MPEPMKHTFAAQAEAARREVRLRERVYPRWVEGGRLTAKKAALEISLMMTIAETLERLAKGDLLL